MILSEIIYIYIYIYIYPDMIKITMLQINIYFLLYSETANKTCIMTVLFLKQK